MPTTAWRFAKFYLVALAVALVLGNADYELAKRTGHAWLSIPAYMLGDGGSRESIGFGYTLLCRHKIDHSEGDRTYYLVGPDLDAWEVFQIYGARHLFDRDYGDLLYYRDNDRADPVSRGSVAGDMLGQKIRLAIGDLLPLATLLALFALWNKWSKARAIRVAERSGKARDQREANPALKGGAPKSES